MIYSYSCSLSPPHVFIKLAFSLAGIISTVLSRCSTLSITDIGGGHNVSIERSNNYRLRYLKAKTERRQYSGTCDAVSYMYVRAQGLRTAGFSRTNVRHEMSGVHDAIHDAIHDADAPNGPTGIIGQSRCTSGQRLWKATLLSCLIMLNDLEFLCISKTNWIDLRFLLQPSRQSHVVVVFKLLLLYQELDVRMLIFDAMLRCNFKPYLLHCTFCLPLKCLLACFVLSLPRFQAFYYSRFESLYLFAMSSTLHQYAALILDDDWPEFKRSQLAYRTPR